MNSYLDLFPFLLVIALYLGHPGSAGQPYRNVIKFSATRITEILEVILVNKTTTCLNVKILKSTCICSGILSG